MPLTNSNPARPARRETQIAPDGRRQNGQGLSVDACTKHVLCTSSLVSAWTCCYLTAAVCLSGVLCPPARLCSLGTAPVEILLVTPPSTVPRYDYYVAVPCNGSSLIRIHSSLPTTVHSASCEMRQTPLAPARSQAPHPPYTLPPTSSPRQPGQLELLLMLAASCFCWCYAARCGAPAAAWMGWDGWDKIAHR